jgi:hypothetical protein
MLIILVVWIAIASAKGSVSTFDQLMNNGIPARGILLRVNSQPMNAGSSGMRRFVTRGVYIDIEIPGRAPYSVSASPIIPTNLDRDVVPGATVELRLDPKNPGRIAIVGPGAGFAASMLGTTQADQRAA